MIRLVSSDIGRKYWQSGPYVLIYGIAVLMMIWNRCANDAPRLFSGYFMSF